MQDFMTDQELIAKQAAIIQALQIEIEKLNDDLKDVRLRFDMKKQLYELQESSILSQSYNLKEKADELYRHKEQVSILNTHIEFLRKSFKKRPKFIMIINRRKRKNGM